MLSEGIDLFKIIDAQKALQQEYQRATSEDDSRALLEAIEQLGAVLHRDRSRHKHNAECGCSPKV